MPAKRPPPKKVRRTARRPSLPAPVASVDSNLTSPAQQSITGSAGTDPKDDISEIPIGALTLSDQTEGVAENAPKTDRNDKKAFRFLDLPAELRIEIYAQFFAGIDYTIDLDSDNYKRIHKKLGIFRTCRTIYSEASHAFYSTKTFRIFPTQPGRFFNTKKPLLARLNKRQRTCLTSLELRLGPGWGAPPRGWVVTPALGLAECVNVRKLTVLVEIDPSDNALKGFRKADGFYERFSGNLLDRVLAEMPLVKRVHFDAWSSVKKSGPMMTGLIEIAKARGRRICWGPERKWTDRDDDDDVAEQEDTSAVDFMNMMMQQQLVY
ncbi:hypothetical protein N657DRAFT_584283 [Parathielavia appendiculata]|uniref:Uncharacterized protein n=1 Tax=Parathielavia appendiculata TaxID=2587402 RepID=A0AAN6TP70_9PEZI|nr:hypothetical protein N657DRAFT_584283 [Parathielavia appendiculata]